MRCDPLSQEHEVKDAMENKEEEYARESHRQVIVRTKGTAQFKEDACEVSERSYAFRDFKNIVGVGESKKKVQRKVAALSRPIYKYERQMKSTKECNLRRNLYVE